MYLLIALLVLFFLILRCAMASLQHSENRPKLNRDLSQTITDEMFMAACSVKDPAIALRVRKVLSDCSGVDEENIHPNDRLLYELGLE